MRMTSGCEPVVPVACPGYSVKTPPGAKVATLDRACARQGA